MIYLQGKCRPIGIKEEDINDENYNLIKNILKDEEVHVHNWIEISLLYYKKKYYKLFWDLTKEGENVYLSKNDDRGVKKELDEKDPSKDGSNFYTLLLLYHLEKIINAKNVNKEDELKIKLENLINQIERRRNDLLQRGVEVDMHAHMSSKKEGSIPWKTYDYLSSHLSKAIYNVNMYLYLLNKYDRKRGANYFVRPRTSPPDGGDDGDGGDNDDDEQQPSEEKVKHEYINPLNYLMESISILTHLVKKNKYDFVAAIYLSLSLCLTYKLDVCIEFSSHLLVRVIKLENFLKSLVFTYQGLLDPVREESPTTEKGGATTWFSKFMSGEKRGTENTDKLGDKSWSHSGRDHTGGEEHLYKCIRLRNLLRTLRKLKAIIKYIIGICYVKKKEWSTASFCLTETIKLDGHPQAYLTNGYLLLMNYIGKIAQCNDFVKDGIHWGVGDGGIVHMEGKNFAHMKEHPLLHLERLPPGWMKNDIRKIPVKDIINLTLIRYYDYLRRGIVKYSKGIENYLRKENSSCHIEKNDIYEYDESIEMANNENGYLKKNHEHVHLSESIIYLYLDLCEIWLMQGDTKSVMLLKLIKDKINFNYINKKCLSKYYFLIGMYHHHILKNIKRALKYFYKGFQIYDNHVNRYYHTICLIQLKKYSKAKKNILFFFQKCRNAYFVKLYVFFFLHTANLFLNFNLMYEGTNDIALPHGETTMGVETNKCNDKDKSKYVSVRSKYMKSNQNEHSMKVVLRMLQHLMNVLETHSYLFHNDLDMKLMKIKIRELLLTKYNHEGMIEYNKELNHVEDIRTFFRKKNKPRKISYELINNYIISLFFCDEKERSVELMELLKREIFIKVKRFSSYYSYAFCDKAPGPHLSLDKEEHRLSPPKEALSAERNNRRKRSASSPESTNKRSKRNGSGSPCEEVITRITPEEEAITGEAKQKRGLLRFSIRRNRIKLYHLDAVLRNHRIKEFKQVMVNEGAKLPKHVYIKRSNRQRYKEIINYLKRIYLTISFNSAVLEEYLGYKDSSIQTYKLYTEMYKTYEGAFIRLANVYIQMKNFSKAKEVIDKGLRTNPKSVNLFLQKAYIHVVRKYYDYCIYALEKLKKNEHLKDDVLINTYLVIIKFCKLKRAKNKEEKNQIVNEIYTQINLLGRRRSNFFVSSLISILLSVNNKYDFSSEAFQLLIDSNKKQSFYCQSALRNFVLHMFNHLMRTNEMMKNKLFLKKINLFFNLSLKNGINDKQFFLCYANFLHLIENFEDAILFLYSAYVKWVHDMSILNTLIICIDSFVSKYLSSDYVELTDILLMGDLICFSFCAIHTLLRFKHLATSAELLASDEQHNYYKEGDAIIEVRREDIEHLASRKYLINTYKKFEEKIKPYIESSVPSMVKQKKMYNQKKINLQKKIYEEKKRKKIWEMEKLKSQQSVHEELLRDVSELTYHMNERGMGMTTLEEEEKEASQEDGEMPPQKEHGQERGHDDGDDGDDGEEFSFNKESANSNGATDKEEKPVEEDISDGDPEYVDGSSSSSDLFEEKKPKKRKKVID